MKSAVLLLLVVVVVVEDMAERIEVNTLHCRKGMAGVSRPLARFDKAQAAVVAVAVVVVLVYTCAAGVRTPLACSTDRNSGPSPAKLPNALSEMFEKNFG